jgi:ribulose-5-phosphate 4-epimerase/fuculose-1-phosphate aldolase
MPFTLQLSGCSFNKVDLVRPLACQLDPRAVSWFLPYVFSSLTFTYHPVLTLTYFAELGWVTGTGGGISIRHSTSDQNLVYLAPSGVQKERITPSDLFVLPYDQPTVPRAGTKRTTLREPKKQGLKESACTPLFWNAFRLRDAGACIHTHSQHAGECDFLGRL